MLKVCEGSGPHQPEQVRVLAWVLLRPVGCACVCMCARSIFSALGSPAGHEGALCEQNVDECAELTPCLNGAVCMDTPGSYKCQCQLGFSGKNCQLVS